MTAKQLEKIKARSAVIAAERPTNSKEKDLEHAVNNEIEAPIELDPIEELPVSETHPVNAEMEGQREVLDAEESDLFAEQIRGTAADDPNVGVMNYEGMGAELERYSDELPNACPDGGVSENCPSLFENNLALKFKKNQMDHLGDIITTVASKLKPAAEIGLRFVPGVNDVLDVCEAGTGREYCVPDGRPLSNWERGLSALGVVAGKGKLYRDLVNHLPILGVTGKAVEFADKHGIKIVTGSEATKVDQVIVETLQQKGDFLSQHVLTADEALQAGVRWVGEGYVERNKKGVFVSRDGLRQFRIDENSIIGAHSPHVPHVHLEEYAPDVRKFRSNNHIPFKD